MYEEETKEVLTNCHMSPCLNSVLKKLQKKFGTTGKFKCEQDVS